MGIGKFGSGPLRLGVFIDALYDGGGSFGDRFVLMSGRLVAGEWERAKGLLLWPTVGDGG